ncbi:hypothetical protein RUM44_011884 [Polyplax serrata]|uniref:Conserved oligomeric Golgi complex subunit 8 n=1 Tax=Polyplax serrata TaxID=468196 RepID=A0ABR1B9S0_POLSC
MANEEENILNVLLSPETYLENPESINYVTQLNQFCLEKLTTEPEKLQEEKNELLNRTQELAFSNYKTFIQRAECLNQIYLKFKSVQENLSKISEELPQFNEGCQNLRNVASRIDIHRKLNHLVSFKSNELLKVLELPQLMEKSIKNGYFEEALELASYIKWLGKKHGHIPLVESIVSDSETLWQVMLNTLIAQLRTDLQLPKCLEIVGLIRRMEVFSDAELRLIFLQGRDTWFQNLLSSISVNDGNQYIFKMIELTRVHLFNIITQYRAIFSDEGNVVPSTIASNVNETDIFYSWLNQKISKFLAVFDNPEVMKSISSLDSVIGQSMYFAHSFSRVGVDFRGLLAAKFIKIIEQNFEHAVWKANKKFKQDMDKFVISKVSIEDKIKTMMETKPEQPPMSLIEFNPLAAYLNGILSAFNEIRTCAALATVDFVANQVQESLKFCAKVILTFHKIEQQTFEKMEKEKFKRFCGGFQILVAYLQKCIHLVFPLQEVASHIGIPVHQLQKEGITYINETAILEPINYLLPVEIMSDINVEPV